MNCWHIIIFPLVEGLSDRCSLSFRPYRDCHDVFYHLKFSFLKSTNSLWFLSGNFTFQIDFNSWVRKNFPFDKFVLKYIFSDRFLKGIVFNDSNFCFILIKFLLDGLV